MPELLLILPGLSIPTSSLGSALLYLGMLHHMPVIDLFFRFMLALANLLLEGLTLD